MKREDCGKLVADFERLLDSWVLKLSVNKNWWISLDQLWPTWRLSVKGRYLNVTRPFSVPGEWKWRDPAKVSQKLCQLSGLQCSERCSSMTWGRARATRSSSPTWISTLSRTWCVTSTVAGTKGSKNHLSYFGLLDCLWLQGEWPSWQIWPTSECCWQVWHQVCLLLTWGLLINKQEDKFADLYDLWMFPYQRLEGGMLSVIVNQPCCWPGHPKSQDLGLFLK